MRMASSTTGGTSTALLNMSTTSTCSGTSSSFEYGCSPSTGPVSFGSPDDPVTVLLHVPRDPVRRTVRPVGQADDGDDRALAQYLFRRVHGAFPPYSEMAYLK